MKKPILILAAAIAFDLGVLVVAGHAATAPAPASGACLKVKLTDCMVTSIAPAAPAKGLPTENLALNFQKFDTVYTPKSCKDQGGTPTTQHGVAGCLLPGRGNGGAKSVMDEISTTR